MDAFLVRGGGPLHGDVRVSGAKNSALKLLAAALLAPGTTRLRNVPAIADMDVMGRVLEHLGVTVTRQGDEMVLDVGDEVGDETPASLGGQLRASIVVLGPLLARCGRVRVATPGGCNLGNRAIDLHLSGLARMGAEVTYGADHVEASAGQLTGADIDLPFASVGATENLLMAAVTAKGETRIGNAAREPEIVDLARFLREMGADINGEGTSDIVVRGVPRLSAARDHRVVGDRIEAGTYAVAAAVTGGNVTISGVDPSHLRLVLEKLRATGCHVEESDGAITVASTEALRGTDVVTLPFPGLPTDLQPQFLLLLSQAVGTSMLTENVYDGRFSVIPELVKLGADITQEGHHAVVRGPRRLAGTHVRATDLRAGATLVVAGLVAVGETIVADPHHVDRGYADLASRLRGLGADVSRTQVLAGAVAG